MTKEELKQALQESVDMYEKMIEDNQNKMIELQERIAGLHEVNKNNHNKIKELMTKLRAL